MARRDEILDALAWADFTEPARVAVISAKLVRELTSYSDNGHTKTKVKDAVRETFPPYGRGKAITELVEAEYRRQAPIYQARQKAQSDWAAYQADRATRATRLNAAYAHAFDRLIYEPSRSNPIHYNSGNWQDRQDWDEIERARDKGDKCIGLTHQDSHLVCLLSHEKGTAQPHIATRLHSGPIVRTYLRSATDSVYSDVKNLVEAATSLGGPKVKAAIARGKRVKTDWIGRRTFIYHDGSDHHHVHIEELQWRAAVWADREGYDGCPRPKLVEGLVHGTSETEHEDGYGAVWNDVD